MSALLHPAEIEALLLSLKVSSVAVTLSLPFAIATALLLARRRFPGKMLIDAIVHMPLVLPPVVIGYLLLITFGTKGVLGHWLYEFAGIGFMFSWTGATLAAAVMTFPFQVRAVRLAIETIHPGLVAAAETLGAGPLDRFFTVILPLALPGIVAGAITAFAASLGQFGAIITFVSNIPGETRTLSLAIYTAIQSPGGEAVAARLVVLSVALALLGLVSAEWIHARLRNRIGQ